jgi:hypothetical protein
MLNLSTIRMVKMVKISRGFIPALEWKKGGGQSTGGVDDAATIPPRRPHSWANRVLIRNCPFVDIFRISLEQCGRNELIWGRYDEI